MGYSLLAGLIDPNYQGILGCCYVMKAESNTKEPKGFPGHLLVFPCPLPKVKEKGGNEKVGHGESGPLGMRI